MFEVDQFPHLAGCAPSWAVRGLEMVVEIAGQCLQTGISSHFLLCSVNPTSEPDPGVLEMETQQESKSKTVQGVTDLPLPSFPIFLILECVSLVPWAVVGTQGAAPRASEPH